MVHDPLPKLTRPNRDPAPAEETSQPPSQKMADFAPLMRVAVIGFCSLVLIIVWTPPNYMNIVERLVATAWFGGMGAGGLLVLRRIERKALWEQRRAAGCCTECGYDLRASPEKCPECGTARTTA